MAYDFKRDGCTWNTTIAKKVIEDDLRRGEQFISIPVEISEFLIDTIKAKAKQQSGNVALFANHLLTELKTRYGVE